jgi:pantothenate kinase
VVVVSTDPAAMLPADLVARARRLARSGRRLLGIAGAPGTGKSTVAEAIVAALAPHAALVPMDGFHLASSELRRLGRGSRKGAPDTFDAAGYVALLRRLRSVEDDVVYAPAFRREIEEAVAGSIPIPRTVPLIVTEGNYLLLDTHPWTVVRELLDEAWYVQQDDDVRVERLIARHIAYGKDPDRARSWVLRSDQRNAELIVTTRHRADLVVELS